VLDSRKYNPRRSAVTQIELSLFWIGLGIRMILRHRLADIGWPLVLVYPFFIVFQIYTLYQDTQDQKYREAMKKVTEEHPFPWETKIGPSK
jgi:hypothetical protein